MNEQDHNNLPAEDYYEADKLDDEFIPDDAWPVCPNCLKPCHPLQNYCDNCDSNEAINPLASYMPFVRIRFIYGVFGKMWRKIWYEKHTPMISRLFYLFMIIIFVPMFLVFGLPFALTDKIKNPQLQKTATIILYILVFVLLMFFFSLLANSNFTFHVHPGAF